MIKNLVRKNYLNLIRIFANFGPILLKKVHLIHTNIRYYKFP